MRKIAQRARFTDERAAVVDWLLANKEALAAVVESWNACAPIQDYNPVAAVEPDGVRAPISDASRCSICLAVIPDLDKPCPTCVESGRLSPTPPAGHGSDIAELQRARSGPGGIPAPNPALDRALASLDVPGSTPPIETVTVVDAPRISNAIKRAPVPPPLPPARVYTADETCRSCGRIAELHQDRGGPLGHSYEAQPEKV